jgi:hypothetical protein
VALSWQIEKDGICTNIYSLLDVGHVTQQRFIQTTRAQKGWVNQIGATVNELCLRNNESQETVFANLVAAST